MKKPLLTFLIMFGLVGATEGQRAPLLTTTWGQNCKYNEACPAVSSGGACGKAYAGCGATAMAQIMKFWGHPSSGWSSNTYTPYGLPTQTANFSAASYNFAVMPNSIGAGTSSEIAQLMYHCGVSVNMQYNGVNSTSYSSDIETALAKYFKYSPKIEYVGKIAYPDNAAYEAKLKAELDAGRPFFFDGGDHFWVIDGYKTGDKTRFHMNWGWGGAYNGYFPLDSLAPGGQRFSNKGAFIGIKPATSLEVSSTEVSLEHDFDRETLRISSENAWAAVRSESWIELSLASGVGGYAEVKLTPLKNSGFNPRTATITITSGERVLVVNVTQKGNPAAINLSQDVLTFEPGGALEQKIDIMSGSYWTVTSTDEWIHFTPSNKTGNGTISVVVDENTAGGSRTGKITVATYSASKEVAIVQQGPLSVEGELREDDLVVWPNPIQSILNIQSERVKVKGVQLFDLYGRRVADFKYGATSYNLSELAMRQGIYILYIFTEEGRRITRKVHLLNN